MSGVVGELLGTWRARVPARALLVALLLGGGLAAALGTPSPALGREAQRATKKLALSLAGREDVRVVVDNPFGGVFLTRAPGDSLLVEARLEAWSPRAEHARALTSGLVLGLDESEEGRLVVRPALPAAAARDEASSWSLELRVAVPRLRSFEARAAFAELRAEGLELEKIALRARHGHVFVSACEGELDAAVEGLGDLLVSNHRGALRAEVAEGTLSVARLAGPLEATLRFGEVELEDVAGAALVEATRADVRARRLSGALRVATRGRVRLEAIAGDVHVESEQGDIRVERVAGALDLQALDGALRVRELGGAALTSSHRIAASGSIDFEWPQGAALSYELIVEEARTEGASEDEVPISCPTPCAVWPEQGALVTRRVTHASPADVSARSRQGPIKIGPHVARRLDAVEDSPAR